MKSRKSKVIERYALGSFVANNQDKITQGLDVVGNSTGSSALKGMSTGLALGSIFPGPGNIIGAGVGLVGGLISNIFGRKSQEKAEMRALRQKNDGDMSNAIDTINAGVNTSNENMYGVYEFGGEVLPNIINIEKGETQVDVESGKILRKYDAINPETGGLYEEHSETGKDSINNMVTADPGTFIITKEASKSYREAVDNKDKITQDTIMQNIRNKKKNIMSGKFADGGDIRKPNITFPGALIAPPPLTGIEWGNNIQGNPFEGHEAAITGNVNPDNNRYRDPLRQVSEIPSNEGGFNFNNVLEAGLQFMPGFSNILQGGQSPNYMNYNNVGVNAQARRNILSNLPQNVSANPALNNIRGARYNSYRDIDRNTADANVRRALKTSASGASISQENEAYYNAQIANNQIRAQRAGILSGLDSEDTRRNMFNAQNRSQIDQINRQMDLAKRQQRNTGLSQIGRTIQNRVDTRNKRSRDNQMMDLLSEILPESAYLIDKFRKGI